jgi:hypothetical protein
MCNEWRDWARLTTAIMEHLLNITHTNGHKFIFAATGRENCLMTSYIVCTFTTCYYGDKIKRTKWVWHVVRMRETRNACKFSWLSEHRSAIITLGFSRTLLYGVACYDLCVSHRRILCTSVSPFLLCFFLLLPQHILSPLLNHVVAPCWLAPRSSTQPVTPLNSHPPPPPSPPPAGNFSDGGILCDFVVAHVCLAFAASLWWIDIWPCRLEWT